MADLTKNFLKGVMNKDNDEIILPEGTYRDALNIDIVHSEGSDAGLVRNKLGNTKVGDLASVSGQLIENCRTIGATTSDTDNLIYYLIASDKFDGVYEFNEEADAVTRVLQSNKSTPTTPSKLAFNKDYLVTGINFLDGFLYWTDDNEQPRRINIARSKSYAIDDDRIDDDILVILAPPLYAPTIDMENEQDQENNMKEKFLQFSHRYKYIDNQYSAMSPWSGTAFVPDNYTLDYGAGENKAMLNSKNRVNISFSTGGQFVEEIELLMRDTKSKNVSIIESFNKEQLNILNNGLFNYRFANNKVYRVLPSAQLTRMFDNVPLKAKAQEVIDRRIVYGNYEQSYNIEDSVGKKIGIDYSVGFVSKATGVEEAIQTFRSDRDYEIGIQYGDSYGRFSTILTSPTTSGNSTVHIPPQNSITGNSVTVEINNNAPAFATHYRLAIKQSEGGYYNIFPILYYADGMYRYFLVNDFDRDKLKVGEYVIFKSDLTGPTLRNKKYKVLEFTSKGGDFLGYNSTTELPGLYFKIKVDSSSEFNPGALYSYSHSSTGTNYQGLNLEPLVVPVYNRFAVAELPIHYGEGNPNILSVVNNEFLADDLGDKRVTIKILSQTTFQYTQELTGSGGWTTTALIPDTDIPININGVVFFNVRFSLQSNYKIGDIWKVNCRSSYHLRGNVFGGVGIPLDGTTITPGDWGGAAVLLGNDWSPTSTPQVDRAIEAQAVITIRVILDSQNPAGQSSQQFTPSQRRYENIEEWFIESGAYNSFVFNEEMTGSTINVGSKPITFRRGALYDSAQYSFSSSWFSWIEQGSSITQETLANPVHMIIQGYGFDDGNENEINVSINIQQAENLAQCETVPDENDLDIYYETTRTYPVVDGIHKVLWEYQDFTFPDPDPIDGLTYTNLGPLVPGTVPDGMLPHVFQVGDQVEVHTSTNPYPSIPGTHTVKQVIDKYNVIIDLLWPGGGASTGGTIGFYHDDFEESDQNNIGSTARIIINPTTNTNSTFNAYAFGNGLESDRIRDNFNSTTIDYSPRASTTIEGYKKERKESSLTYSGTYQDKTSTNGLNEFNYSLVNFKNLDISFGSVQKLYARDTDLMVYQEDKISRVLYGKNLWSDAIGGGTVGVTPEVLGTQISDKGEWGISFNPESFAQWGTDVYWTDSRRGAVLSMGSEGISVISNSGMGSYFRELMRTNPNTQKIGVFDPYSKHYVIAANNYASKPCYLTLSKYNEKYPASNSAEFSAVNGFNVYSNASWTVAISYTSGTGWVTDVPSSGFGNAYIQPLVANNGTSLVRGATITFTFCGGKTISYEITQGRGKRITVFPWVLTASKI